MTDERISSTAPRTNAAFTVRPATPSDVPAVWDLVVEFATFERMEHLANGSAERLASHLFGEGWPRVECLVAESDGTIAGYALFYAGYSTFWTRPLMWLEDLFVPERFRGRGLGRALFSAVARIAVERGCPRMDWAVLDWNTPALEFYQGLGPEQHDGWHAYRLSGEKLLSVAAQS